MSNIWSQDDVHQAVEALRETAHFPAEMTRRLPEPPPEFFASLTDVLLGHLSEEDLYAILQRASSHGR